MNNPDIILRIALIAITLIFWNAITYHLGRIAMFIATFGKYPRKELTKEEKGRVITVGFFVLIAIMAILIYVNNKS